MNLKRLNESFINRAREPMFRNALPVTPVVNPRLPIVPVEKWNRVDGKLTKPFKFISIKERNAFIASLLEYEAESEHNADMMITENSVTLFIWTKGVDVITELDKEYGRFADMAYKDSFEYCPSHE